MIRSVLILATLLFTSQVFAQKTKQAVFVNEFTEVDNKALEIPDSLTKTTDGIAAYVKAGFSTDKDKVRAIFVWIATNLQYDVENMYAINFYEKKEEKIAKPLKTRKGICENYAALFEDICTKAGIKAYTISGYTKQNGTASYLPHAWNAALVDTTWYLFDVTWASGYTSNEKFIRRLDNSYYKVSPSKLIKSHMPFDYLWQFLNYPITNQEFYEGKVAENKSKPFFSYTDSLAAYEQLTHNEQLAATAARIERNGIKNSMIFDRLRHIKLEIEEEKQMGIVNLYNSAVADFNGGVNSFNEFINYKNKQFTPKKTDAEIQEMMDLAANQFKDARTKLNSFTEPDGNLKTSLAQLNKQMDEVLKQVREQQDWLKAYFAKGKMARRAMFYEIKPTIFGQPID